MGKVRLDPKLLQKLSEKTGKSVQRLREQLARRASRNGISSEAALVLWAKEVGIGAANYQRKLPSNIQQEVRDALPSIFTRTDASPNRVSKKAARKTRASPVRLAIEYLLEDSELYDRCKDLLKASRHFDRAFREATTVLDDRLKRTTGIENMKPLDLVGKAVNPDPQKAIVEVTTNKAEQEGFHGICKGIMLSFRDPTHHVLSNKFTRQDALKFCGFVDAILAIINQATIHRDRV